MEYHIVGTAVCLRILKITQSDQPAWKPKIKIEVLGSEFQASGTYEGQAGNNKKTTPRFACVFWTT
jgi:hypothetical protein